MIKVDGIIERQTQKFEKIYKNHVFVYTFFLRERLRKKNYFHTNKLKPVCLCGNRIQKQNFEDSSGKKLFKTIRQRFKTKIQVKSRISVV